MKLASNRYDSGAGKNRPAAGSSVTPASWCNYYQYPLCFRLKHGVSLVYNVSFERVVSIPVLTAHVRILWFEQQVPE